MPDTSALLMFVNALLISSKSDQMEKSHKYNSFLSLWQEAGWGNCGKKNLPDFLKDHIFHLKSCLMCGQETESTVGVPSRKGLTQGIRGPHEH